MTDQTESASERACSCHAWDDPPVPCAQRYAFTECLQATIRALEAKVREAESEHAGVVATLGKALRDLSFAAQTTGGTAGRDEGLVAAIDGATQALSLIGVSRSIDLVSDLRADRDRLAGEVERTRQQYAALLDGHGTVMDARDRLDLEVARLTSELAAAREDAKRYRWLRDHSTNKALFYMSVHETYHEVRFTPREVDAHIDALAAIDLARARGEGNADE